MTARQRTPQKSRSFSRRIRFKAPRERVFDAITTLDGLRGWCTPFVRGSAGTLRFEFEGLSQHIIMRVDEARPDSLVKWTCLTHSALAEWNNTSVVWDLRQTGRDQCELRLEHVGLNPGLECYDHCEVGWDHYLSSITGYVERGRGTPYRSSGKGVGEALKRRRPENSFGQRRNGARSLVNVEQEETRHTTAGESGPANP